MPDTTSLREQRVIQSSECEKKKRSKQNTGGGRTFTPNAPWESFYGWKCVCAACADGLEWPRPDVEHYSQESEEGGGPSAFVVATVRHAHRTGE